MTEHRRSSSRERAVAFVVARLDSSRLPNKHFRAIGGKPLLTWIISRLRQCQELDEVVIATVAEPVNQALLDFTRQEQVACFWYEGGVDEVTTRLRKAAEYFQADICVLISGDCPLISPVAVDYLIRELRRHPEGEVIQVPPDQHGQPAALEGVSAARCRAWQRADDLSDRPELKEHQFPIIRFRPELFQTVNCAMPANLYALAHRLSVDTWADLEFMNRVWEVLTAQGKPFELPEVLQLLQEQPEIRRLNAHVHQRGLKETVHPVLFLVDAGPRFGYGHLIRCQELGLQVVERLGWPATFLVDDQRAVQLLQERGLPVVWGAWERPAQPSPNGQFTADIQDLVARHHLLVVDTYPREVTPGWRQRIAPHAPVVVLDKAQEWSREADILIFPGVTAPETIPEGNIPGTGLPTGKNFHQPRIFSGLDFVILRREIRRFVSESHPKDLDILAYLHHPHQRELLRSYASHRHFKIHLISGFDQDFPRLLARSKIFISGFGYSFYEALALQAYPVTWPFSPSHREGAQLFYRRLGMSPAIIDEEDHIDSYWPFLDTEDSRLLAITDGTPNIVGVMSSLLPKDG